MLNKYQEAEKYVKKLEELSKNLPEIRDFAFKAKFFTSLDQSQENTLKMLENLPQNHKNDYTNFCLAVFFR